MQATDDELNQLQNAIKTLETQRPILGDVVVDTLLGPIREKLAALKAQSQPTQQRKLATVLFADVSGFTALSETMDAEVVAGIMNDLWAAVDRAITDHGGRIDKHIGDAVMALWGAEAAREDDPERAVRGALAMQAAIDEFCTSQSAPLAMRISVNTGPVLLGAVGSTAEFTAMGDAVNLASRLEHAAPVGGILISHDTYRHVRGVFDVIVRDPLSVKGKVEPVQTYLVQRAKPRSFRMATRGVEGIETRMVGRDHELGMLQEAYADAIESVETRVVTVIGEAGVGKSRLLYEFDNWIELQPEQVYYFKGRGTANTQNVAYSLFRDLFAFRFDIRDSDSAAVALAKFQSGMSPYIEPDQAAVAGQWLGFDFSASEAVQRLLGATGFAETARAYLTRYFRGVLAEDPAVILLEDIHWADDSSLDLAAYLPAAIPEARLLVVAVTRPSLFERRPGWGEGEAAFRKVNLAPLSKRASRALVEEILQRVEDIPDSLRDLIVDAAEGNPFYVEEMVKMLIDQGVIERVTSDELRVSSEEARDSSLVARNSSLESWRVRTDRLEGLKVPPTLTGLLQARLDGLPQPEREALQRASVVGRLFWDDCVAELLETERAAVDPTLQAVRGRELIFRREYSAFAHAGEYIFKHALLRDVAYETVLLKHRAAFHGKVARWLEKNAGERHDEYLGLIAEHYIRAGDELKAAKLLELSGYEAIAVGAYAAARQALERALALREAAGETDGPAVTQAAIALGRVLRQTGDLEAALAMLAKGLAGARRRGDRAAEAEALARQGFVLHDLGRFDELGTRVETALALGRTAAAAPLIFILRAAAGYAWSTGDLKQADSLAAESLALARTAGDVDGETNALNMLGIIAAGHRDLDRSRQYYEAALELARRGGNLSLEGMMMGNLGHNAYRRGDYVAARAYALAALDRDKDLGEKLGMVYNLTVLAQADLGLGDISAARQEVREALALARSLGMTPMVVWGLLLAGQVLAAAGQPDRGLALFGLARAHPALEHQAKLELDEAIAGLGLPEAQIEAGLAAGAALDLETVVGEILDGEW
jgi:class 3 adenylate cyclase/tetratricopeptide (TPR) repeat protein